MKAPPHDTEDATSSYVAKQTECSAKMTPVATQDQFSGLILGYLVVE